MRAYGQSKLANVLFTRALARRLAGSGVTANALHPGAVRTKILSGITGALSGLVGLFLLSPDEGARTSIFLATSPDVAETSGLYFVKSKAASTSAIAMDDTVAERLWQVSARMTGIGS
jgi:NAD(P)-dependent dehydrogenase (short-subunit alcohol dehydrogenase family)